MGNFCSLHPIQKSPKAKFIQKQAHIYKMKIEKPEIIYGRHPVLDALDAGQSLEKIFLLQGTRGPFEKELRAKLKGRLVPVQYVPKEKLNRMTSGNHQGVVAFVAPVDYYELEDVLPGIFEKSDTPLLLFLDGVTDVRNLGAIARSAEVLGAHAMVVPAKGSALITPEAIKTSAGALARIPLCRTASLVNALEWAKMSGIKVFSSQLGAKKRLQDLDLTVPAAFIIGSEDEGVSPAVAGLADEAFHIEQSGQTDSLNVSVATGIMLYEVLRQRRP